MMRPEDNELLTRTGPGTPMGELMRQYWMPALVSTELAAGGAPVRLRMLSEDFVAFRSPDGSVGVVDHRCPHRCASLFYGRNEAGGIRCVYHGWKFDPDGRCIEMPSEPPETDFKDQVRVRALPTREQWGAVWVYMGPRETPPPFPKFDLDFYADGEVTPSPMFRECNWLQALDGDIDTCHVGFLHAGGFSADRFEPGSLNYYRALNVSPKYECLETPFGTVYTAYRPAGDLGAYHRVGEFALPFWTVAPSEPMGVPLRLRAWVPVDDESSMLFMFSGGQQPALTRDRSGKVLTGATVELHYLPNTTDWKGRWRLRENRGNDHLIDRELQRTGNYTGIVSIPVQDHAITEGMGPIVDRSLEHLGTSDGMIMLTRRRLALAARALVERGEAPPGVDEPEVYRGFRAGYMVIPYEIDWLDEVNRFRAGWGGRPLEPEARPRRARLERPTAPEPAE